jgi:hypothetical protein
MAVPRQDTLVGLANPVRLQTSPDGQVDSRCAPDPLAHRPYDGFPRSLRMTARRLCSRRTPRERGTVHSPSAIARTSKACLTIGSRPEVVPVR